MFENGYPLMGLTLQDSFDIYLKEQTFRAFSKHPYELLNITSAAYVQHLGGLNVLSTFEVSSICSSQILEWTDGGHAL